MAYINFRSEIREIHLQQFLQQQFLSQETFDIGLDVFCFFSLAIQCACFILFFSVIPHHDPSYHHLSDIYLIASHTHVNKPNALNASSLPL